MFGKMAKMLKWVQEPDKTSEHALCNAISSIPDVTLQINSIPPLVVCNRIKQKVWVLDRLYPAHWMAITFIQLDMEHLLFSSELIFYQSDYQQENLES